MHNVNFRTSFEVENAKLALNSISIYRNLLKDKVIGSLYVLLDYVTGEKVDLDNTADLYNDFFFKLAQSGSNSLENYIVNKIVFDENPFSIKQQFNKPYEGQKDIENAVKNDLKNLQIVARFKGRIIKDGLSKSLEDSNYKFVVNAFPEWDTEKTLKSDEVVEYIKAIKEKFYNSDNWDKCVDDLKNFHGNYGCGEFAKYRAFAWDHIDGKEQFKGISNPDPIQLSQLIGYKDERSVVIENTLQFLKGFSSNNVLLHGDRGTGKSSTVKAILNKYYAEGLRMIELPKAYIVDFPEIIRNLKNRSQKFIVFIDDLVFGDNEESYTTLKSVLEGGLESRSSNILIYATSNRRHLVKEYFSDREQDSDELHVSDSKQEKLSLADRFGINVLFSSPDKKEYLEIVDGLANRRKIDIDKEILHREANKWEMWYNGRSARTAVQFIDWLEGHKLVGDELTLDKE